MTLQKYLKLIDNGATVILSAAVDPELSDDDYEKVRAAIRARWDLHHPSDESAA